MGYVEINWNIWQLIFFAFKINEKKKLNINHW